jgi:hypothetical protein
MQSILRDPKLSPQGKYSKLFLFLSNDNGNVYCNEFRCFLFLQTTLVHYLQ